MSALAAASGGPPLVLEVNGDHLSEFAQLGIAPQGAQRRVAVGWFLGVIAFLAIVAAGNDLFLRVELGILGGALVAALAMGVFTQTRLHEHLRALPHTLTALDEAVR